MENYKPIEGVVSQEPVEKRYAGDMNPSKRAQQMRANNAANTAIKGTVEFKLPEPQNPEAEKQTEKAA